MGMSICWYGNEYLLVWVIVWVSSGMGMSIWWYGNEYLLFLGCRG